MVPAQVASRRTDVDDITLTQLSLVRDSVADDFVDGPDLGHERTVGLGDRGRPTCRLISGTRDS